MDNRYTINREFCGHKEQRYVVRWCGDWLSSHDTHVEAVTAAQWHDDQRLSTDYVEHREIISESNGVQLYAGNHMYKVVYGAEVSNHITLDEAFAAFTGCIFHALQSEGHFDATY